VVVEQANIQDGLFWLKRRRNSEILSEEFLRELHRRLFGTVWNWAGTFRKTGKNVESMLFKYRLN
jgi:fido (protein-threonine AMPylation protein)